MELLLEAEVVAAASEDLEAAARRSRASALRLALFFLDFFLLLFLLKKCTKEFSTLESKCEN